MLKYLKILYVQVLIAICIGILLGHFYPQLAVKMQPLGAGFIKLIKMVIAPLIFCTVVTGIAGMQDLKAVSYTHLDVYKRQAARGAGVNGRHEYKHPLVRQQIACQRRLPQSTLRGCSRQGRTYSIQSLGAVRRNADKRHLSLIHIFAAAASLRAGR